MIYIVLGLVALIVLLRRLAPVQYAVHSSKAAPLPVGVHAEGRWMLAGFIYDEDGHRLDVTDKFIGRAEGGSMVSYDIPPGATFIGDYLKDAEKQTLEDGEIVVVNGAAEFSETGLRLRCIEGISSDGTATFLPDSFGRKPRPRPISEIHARVTHVIDNSRAGNGEWIASLLRSMKRLVRAA